MEKATNSFRDFLCLVSEPKPIAVSQTTKKVLLLPPAIYDKIVTKYNQLSETDKDTVDFWAMAYDFVQQPDLTTLHHGRP